MAKAAQEPNVAGGIDGVDQSFDSLVQPHQGEPEDPEDAVDRLTTEHLHGDHISTQMARRNPLGGFLDSNGVSWLGGCSPTARGAWWHQWVGS